MPSSFRNNLQQIPSRYRTPSPPRDAFEPLSPIIHEEDVATESSSLRLANNVSDNNHIRRRSSEGLRDGISSDGPSHTSGGAMDAFASIALATTPHGPNQPTTSTVDPRSADGHRSERHLKRARSEKPSSPDWPRKRACIEARPTTSYEQSPEDRKLEAELLLNFAQEAAKLVSPSPVLHHASIHHTRAISETTNHGRLESNCYDQTSVIQQHASKDAQTLGYTKRETHHFALQQHDATMHETGDTYRPQTVGPTKMDVEKGHVLPITGDNVRTDHGVILPETSKDDDVGLTGDAVGLEQGVPTGVSDRSYISDPQSHADVSSLDAKTHTEEKSVEQSVLDGDHQIPTNLALPLNDTSQNLEDAVRIEDGDPRLKGEPVEEGMSPEVEKLPEENIGNESRTVHGPLSDQEHTGSGRLSMAEERPGPPSQEIDGAAVSDVESNPGLQGQPKVATAVCTACSLTRNINGIDMENNSTSWISCDACKSWFHLACAGFKSEREVRGVDKFRCRRCKPVHGPTTYVRKSSRAHSAIDYAGLHQGVIKTSDERPEHHYIKPIKEGTISFQPENFARMRPELVTAEFFEKGNGMKEPIVIPACLNPRSTEPTHTSTQSKNEHEDVSALGPLEDDEINTEWFSRHPESESVPDHGQDALDMVIPQGLTVRQVAELYGPEEKVEVIDVKSQNGENKKWNMRRWADYYENPNNKVVRNVISLEVSQSKLGRLIRRPQIVRDLDLQDSVWPEELLAKGEYPRVQFYTLMSVADCFTDFHIDFGGSSVFYHILKGKKTFLFIPPKEKYLKKYEEWCMSPAQNWTFLGNQTKECYRVDLSEGDTMLIPSGWIHAVWTPEDSLVIGGNFLTRMNFGMQLRVAQVEKATGVARKFKYPHFQKLHWYTAIQYLERDPLPSSVRDMLHAGGSVHREQAAYYDFDHWGENSRAGPENYHARYYSQPELEGLPDLLRYLLRTALIDIGSITDGISADTRNAVKKSIPRGHGEPLDVMKAFAAWCAWKRGNEPIPHWAYPDAVPDNLSPDKLSAAATKKLDREAALLAPRRHSARMQSQQEAASAEVSSSTILSNTSPASVLSSQGPSSTTPKRPRPQSGAGVNSHRKTACESCRKRRRACKHKGEVASSVAASAANAPGLPPMDHQMMPQNTGSPSDAAMFNLHNMAGTDKASEAASATNDGIKDLVPDISTSPQARADTSTQIQEDVSASQFHTTSQDSSPEHSLADPQISGDAISSLDTSRGYSLQARPRHKACNECRKSKRRCIHDAFGNEDPIKVRETAIPRPHARKSNVPYKGDFIKKTDFKHDEAHQTNTTHLSSISTPLDLQSQVNWVAPVANMIAQPSLNDPHMDDAERSPEAAAQKIVAVGASALLDPALFLDDSGVFAQKVHDLGHMSESQSTAQNEKVQQSTIAQSPEGSEDHCYAKTVYTAEDSKAEPVRLEPRESFGQPASSLVSPPASSLDDAGESPTVAALQCTPSRSSSEQSGGQQKQIQRYTPESGPTRRASSGSYGENHRKKFSEPRVTEQPSDQDSKPGPRPGFMADDESLRLIKELQAQDLGLRRRTRA